MIAPIEKLLIKKNISPNQITITTTILSIGVTVLFANGLILIAGWYVLLLGSLDILDGRVARATQQVTKHGEFLDASLDRYQDFFMILGLVLYFRTHWIAVFALLAMAGTFFVSYVRAMADNVDVDVSRVGTLQRPERIFLVGFGSILSSIIKTSLYPFVANPGDHVLMAVIIVLAIGTNWTAIHRIRYAIGQLSK